MQLPLIILSNCIHSKWKFHAIEFNKVILLLASSASTMNGKKIEIVLYDLIILAAIAKFKSLLSRVANVQFFYK